MTAMTDRQDSVLDPRSSPARDARSNRGTLQFIARQAMIDHGLEPEFPPAALKPIESVTTEKGATYLRLERGGKPEYGTMGS